jgi:hypothetical protein
MRSTSASPSAVNGSCRVRKAARKIELMASKVFAELEEGKP